MMWICLRVEPWGIAAKIKFKKATAAQMGCGALTFRTTRVQTLLRELPLRLFDDARASLQASLLAVAISCPAGWCIALCDASPIPGCWLTIVMLQTCSPPLAR